MSDKIVSINIRRGFRLPHNIEGIDIVAADMLVDLATKHRLMTLRPNLFHESDPDWPAKVERVEIAGEIVEGAPAVEGKPKGKGKKSDGDHPA